MITQATKCKHCKKAKGNHQAKTGFCPTGRKYRIGYCSYSTSQKFEPNAKAVSETN